MMAGKKFVLLGCYTESNGNSLPTFRFVTTQNTVLIYLVPEAQNKAMAGKFPLITGSRLNSYSEVSQHKATVLSRTQNKGKEQDSSRQSSRLR
jgi:hypothetical protein